MILRTVGRLGLLYRRPPYLLINFSSVSYNDHVIDNLCKHLDLPASKAEYLCLKYPFVRKLDEETIVNLIERLYKLGYSKNVLIEQPLLFLLLPVTLTFRYKVLQECGMSKIQPKHIVSYLTLVKQKTIGELKKERLISIHMNVENRLASYLTQWPTSLTNVIYGDVNESTLYTLRLRIIQRYLELLLDLTNDEFNRGLQTYPTIKHRPLEAINEALNLLQSTIMMPNQKIKSNLYLIHVDPENLKNIIYKFRSIGGIDIKEIIRLHPKLANKQYNTLVAMRKVLQEYGISNEAQKRCFDIYTLAPSTVKERIENAKTIPEFATFFDHPRFLKMIHYNKTAMKRLRNLYSINKKCLSLNVLSGSSAHFETFEKSPGDRLGKGKDLLFCISQSLGKDYSISDIRQIVKRHPFWINIPLVQVKYVYDQLSLQFTKREIYENCAILLYPWSKIKEILGAFHTKTMSKPSNSLHEHLDISKLNESQKLSLILYILEKSHYFSGNGVWTEEKCKSIADLTQSQEVKNVSLKQTM